jgi:hypothetical protein
MNTPNGSESHAPAFPSAGGLADIEQLESRVRRLEDALGSLQDTRPLEERVFERVSARVQEQAGTQALQSGAGLLLDAGRLLLPRAVEAVQNDTPAYRGPVSAPTAGQSWLPLEMFQELRAMWAMFTDYRYRPGWAARVVPVGMAILYVFSFIFIGGTSTLGGGIPLVGWIIDRLLGILLAVVAYKALAREANRYRQLFPLVGGRR